MQRIEHLWSQARTRFAGGGDFLFGDFSAADAMFAPVVMRFKTYAPPLSPEAQRYCDAVRASRGVRSWVEGALQEKEFVADDEPYATPAK